MKKRFFKVALLSLLTVALPTTFTGCKDYDDDIDNLDSKTDDIQKQLNALSEALKGYQSEAATAAQAAQDAAAKAQAAADQAEKDAQEAIALAKAAQAAAAQAKADAVAQIMAELKNYATTTDLNALADRITAVENTIKTLTGGSDVTNLAQTVATLQNQVNALNNYKTLLEQLSGLNNAAQQIKDATAAIATINGEITTIKNNYSDLTQTVSGLDQKLQALSNLVGSINQNLVVIMGKQLRSLVFIPELYADGIESVEYEYNWFKPLLTSSGSLTTNNESGVSCTVISKADMWNFTKTGANKAFNPVKTVDYHMNPSSAVVTADQVSFVSKDVQVISRASVAALAMQKDAFKTEKGIMTVGFTADGPKIKTGAQKEGSIFAAQAKIQKANLDTTITSDYAMLYASQVIPQAIAFNNSVPQAKDCKVVNRNDELYTTMKEAIENKPSRTVAYTSSINLNELEIHYDWVTNTKNAGTHLIWKYGEEKHYGLSYKYELIDYTSGTNKTSESKYCKLSGDENSVLTPWAVNEAGEPAYENGIASVGRQPIVRVTVMCGNDVVLVGFIKVQIVKEEAFKITNLIDLGNINFGCADATKSVQWSTISDYILQNTAALSKDEFNQLYKLDVDAQGNAIQYVYNASKNSFSQASATAYIGDVTEVGNATGTTTDVLKWILSTADQQTVYEKAGHTATIYVAYVHKTAPTIYATIYVPMKVQVTKPNAATVTTKVQANWMRNQTVTMFNVPQPTDNALPTPFTQNLNEAWATGANSKPSFTVQAGFPSFTAATFANQGVNLEKGGYKYYFTAANNRTLDGVTYSVDNATVKGLIGHSVAVKNMGDHALLANNGEYTNTKLYAKVGSNNKEVIATIDQNTGIITYEKNTTSEYVLNLYQSNGNGLDRTNAKLFAEIGICAYNECGITMPLTNGVYSNIILRPINIYSTSAEFTDAVANGSKVDVFSLLSFDDWRGVKFEGKNAWLFAYYDVTNVNVRLADMTTDAVNGSFQKFDAVTAAFSMEDNAAMTWVNRTEANAENILNKAKNSFGTIVYDNSKYNKNTFKVRIPVDVTYYWGTITVQIEATVNNTLNPVGIQFNMLEDTVYVIQTISGGPSQKVGIMPGDRIISANDTVLAGKKMVNTQVMKHLRGPKGSEVNLRVKRASDTIDFRVVRDDIPLYSVDETFMADPTTGYIRITRFAEDTGREVRDAIAKLRKQGMKDLIIDLSDNGGGYLGAAFEVAGEFLPKGTPVVSTEGRRSPKHTFVTENSPSLANGRVVIIANQFSASAAEILSGALQDNDRGLIVGRRTFGKGLVQRPFPFPDGSMIRLTVSRYYTPSGRCIQKHYDKGHSEEYQLDVYNRYKSGELWSADSIQRPDSLKYLTLKNKRPVYGGGGIIPDVFVPADTSYFSVYYRDLVARGVLNRTVINYVDSHRAELKAEYPTDEAFQTSFAVPEELLDKLTTAATDAKIEFNEEQWNRSKPMIEAIMKGLIARDLFEDGSYYRPISVLNPDFIQALKLIHDPDRYTRILNGEPDGSAQ